MKKPLIIFLLLLISSFLFAQEKDSLTQAEKERREQNIQAGNPFKKYGYTPKIATLSKGKYLEWHDLDSIVIIGSVYYNTKSKKIIDFVERDMTNPDAQPLSDIRGRWISPDPLAEEFPDWSPYAFVYNNPLRFVDPTGMAGEDIIYLNASGQEIHRVTSNQVFEVHRVSVGGMAGLAIGAAASTSQTVQQAQTFNEVFASVLDTPSSMSMSFTGEANAFSGTDSQGRDRFFAEGTLSISVGFDNGVSSEIIQEGANSGPYGFGPIPNGSYEATGITNTSESGMVRNGVGFKVFLTDNESLNRNQLRIHPDQTPSTGTAGCIGLTCGANSLREVRGQIQNHFNNNPATNIPVNVSITNNPNYDRPKGGTQNSGE
ncbi:MAG: hypothetical protein H3C39_09755 [Flavobacteriia bacterium]|nr:hypothetical protein [Flavobacteriia bacterium]